MNGILLPGTMVESIPTKKNYSHFQHCGDVSKTNGSSKINAEKVFIKGNRRHGGMNESVTNIKHDEWKITRLRHSSLYLNTSEHYLSEWRTIVEGQGCAFIANIMFRDPLSYALNVLKHIDRYNSSRDVWTKHLYI